MKILLFTKSSLAFLLLISLLTSFAFALDLPSPAEQKNIFKALRDEIIRLDGVGLLSRKDRSETFYETTEKLANEISTNTSVSDFYSSFQRLDAAYTNLHSRVIFPSEISQQIELPLYKRQSIWMFAEADKKSVKFKIEYIEDPELEKIVSAGDEIIAINGRSIKDWLSENFLFCKYSLSIQCDRKFESNLLSLYLSWKGNTDLIYSIKHKDKIIDVKNNFFTHTSETNALKKRCDYQADKRYKEFKLIHLGHYACLFQKIDDPTIALLRISSFMYKRTESTNPYKSVEEEVAALEKVWLPNAGLYKNLIIDVLNNGGGNLPIAYYKILFQGKFQEQYYQTKKIPEFEDARLRSAMTWQDPSHELQYQIYLNNGVWDSLKYGDFTPPEPMFCADPEKPCLGPMFEAKAHDFNGKVHIMLNENCVSSCDGFVWALKQKLNADLYGFYQAADSAYIRLRIDVVKDDSNRDGFKIETNPQHYPLPNNLIIAQVVTTSRATDAAGNILSGNPLELEEFVPYKLGEFYPTVVLNKILDALK